jgi:hypothetical protein
MQKKVKEQVPPFHRIPEISNRMLRLLIEEDFKPPVYVVIISRNNVMQFEKVVDSKEGASFETEFIRWCNYEDCEIQFPIRMVLLDEVGKAIAVDISLSNLIDFNPN